MRNCATAVLEQGNVKDSNFETEPFEAGWASEACWFVRLLEPGTAGNFTLVLIPQVSPDGLLWCDAPNARPHTITGPVRPTDVAMLPQTHFGNWLRLKAELAAGADEIKVLIHLVLKE